ncbi:MAG: hypothetical protein MUF58_23920 [Arcicella sp.]|jgi:hypothetical protein|nr:hypothetical protein [Arcicella sp.]
MKTKLFILGLFTSLALIQSCSKSEAPAPSMVGYWVGKYGNGSGAAQRDLSYLLYANGTMRIYDGNNTDTAKADKGKGTYFVSGTKINGTGTSLVNSTYRFSFVATTDEQFTTMSGTWGSGTTTTGNTFFLNKK